MNSITWILIVWGIFNVLNYKYKYIKNYLQSKGYDSKFVNNCDVIINQLYVLFAFVMLVNKSTLGKNLYWSIIGLNIIAIGLFIVIKK